MKTSPTNRRIDREALQARLAWRVSACLTERAERLPQDVTERLRVAREQAVRRTPQVRQAGVAAAPVIVAWPRGAAALGAPPSWWLRLASVLPLLLLVVGLVLIQQLHERAEIDAAADVDAALLADDLPPAAYDDPGFLEYMKHTEP